jgi:hypothetical protein
MTITEAPAAPLSVENIIRRVKLSASDAKAVSAAQARVAEIMEIIAGCEPDRNGRLSKLHGEADKIEAEFYENPTPEGAEKLHGAILRLETAKMTFGRIDAGCHHALEQASAALAPVAMKALDDALATLDTEAAATRAALVKTATVFSDTGEIAIFDSRLAVTRANLEAERTEARHAPLHWLASKGLA